MESITAVLKERRQGGERVGIVKWIKGGKGHPYK